MESLSGARPVSGAGNQELATDRVQPRNLPTAPGEDEAHRADAEAPMANAYGESEVEAADEPAGKSSSGSNEKGYSMTDTTEILPAPETPQKSPWRKRLRRFFTGTNAVIVFIAALVAIAVPVWPHLRPSSVYTFTDPSSDGVTPKACAFTATGQGQPSAGKVIVVSNQVQGVGDNVDPLLHFGQATLMPNTDKWYIDLQIGIKSTSPGTPYKLTAWLVDANWVASMIQNLPHQRTWWNDKQPPPGATQVATASVTRNAVANC